MIFFAPVVGLTQSIGYQSGATAPVPEQVYWYEFEQPTGWSTENCNYNWITNGQSVFTTSDGSAAGSNDTKKVYVKWLNSILNNNDRTITVTTNGCDSTGLNVIRNLTIQTKYLPPPTFKTAGGSTITSLNVPCYANEITLRLESIADAEYYRWELPAGWSRKGSPGVNLFSTTTPNVEVTVAEGASNTSIKAYTSIASFNGPGATLPVTRNADQISITTNPLVYCSSIKPVTYQATGIPGLTYTWTYPSGWSCQSGCNSSTITLVPDGSNVQGQAVTARGSTTCASQNIQTNIASANINFSTAASPDFTISGPLLVCTSPTPFTLSNVAPTVPITWTATPANLFAVSSGNGANTTLSAANSNSSGQGMITFTIDSGCGNPVQVERAVWVGSPSISSFNYINTSFPEWPATGDVCTNSVGHYTASIHPDYPSSHYADIFWSASGAQLSMSSGSAVTVIYNGPVGTYATISATAVGQCGQEAGHHTVLLLLGDCGGGGIIMAYPNPVKEELIVSLPEAGSEVTLYNSSQSVVYSQVAGGNEVIVPVKELPNGTYYLHIRSSKGLLQRQIMVSH